MDEISNKAISIGVAVFITIAIVSGIFYVINEMKDIYAQVYNTDISIQSSFSEFEQYENTQKTGIDVLNTVKKYINDSLVKVKIADVEINSSSVFYTNYINKKGTDELDTYLSNIGKDKYSATVSTDQTTNITTIAFTKIN